MSQPVREKQLNPTWGRFDGILLRQRRSSSTRRFHRLQTCFHAGRTKVVERGQLGRLGRSLGLPRSAGQLDQLTDLSGEAAKHDQNSR